MAYSHLRAVLGVLASLFVASPAAAVEDLNYDPASCQEDARGSLFIALGRNVLAVSPHEVPLIDEVRRPIDRFSPPHPDELTGCPGNPLQLTSYAFIFAYNAARGIRETTSPIKSPPDLVELIRTTRGDDPPGADKKIWAGEKAQLELAKTFCSKATLREELSNGMTACRIGDSRHRKEDWQVSYQAPATYKTPEGRPFVVNCSAFLASYQIGHCDVAYTLVPDVGVAYRFQPYLGPRAIPIDKIIAYDQTLRAQITAILLQDYVWPAQSP